MDTVRHRILLVDDEAENLKALERLLHQKYDLKLCESPKEAIGALQGEEFAVIVSDQRMPEMSGSEFLAIASKQSPMSTRVLLTGFTDTKEMLEAINRAEIYRYVVKPWENEDLLATLQQASEHYSLKKENKALLKKLEEKEKDLEAQVELRTAELKVANEKLLELAITDPLTKVFNRRVFSGRMTEEIERSRRYDHPIAVAMIDIDHFKQFNDMEGHPIGDEALKKCAHVIKAKIRKTDVLSRYGGEEFCLMMPETDLDGARNICERLRSSVEDSVFQGKKGRAYLTVSVGLAGFPEHGDNIKELIEAADEALYKAKDTGRNRVMVKSEDASSFFMR